MERNQPSDWKIRATDELIRGRESANQLLQLLDNWNADEGSTTPFAQDLLQNILRSFTSSLLLINSICQSDDDVSVRDSSSRKCPKSENLEESCKTLTTKNRRGCYKRKRNIPTWTKETPVEIDDGHVWRKYGQKKILSVKYLRNYYRCTHKEQGCQAIKQVQRIQEDPPFFHTTYYGHHTCNSLQYSDVMLDYPASPPHSSILLSFNDTLPIPSKQDKPLILSSPKIEPKDEINSNYHDMTHNQLSSNCDYIPNSYELSLDSSRPETLLTSTLETSDHGDFISCVMIESVVVDEDFKPFDF